MAYVSVTGGQEAIAESQRLTQYLRLKGAEEEQLSVQMIAKQMRLLVDQVMGEGGMYAPEYAALALKQAEGDPAEAAFLIRAYRSTLPRNHYSCTVEPGQMRVLRRISSSFRDIPGGQMLGVTYDYTHRLLDFSLRNETREQIRRLLREYEQMIEAESAGDDEEADADAEADANSVSSFVKVADLLREQGLLEQTVRPAIEQKPFDITREKLTFPAERSARLQALARGETGAMVALAYSSMRGYGAVHPTIGELRVGYVTVEIPYPYGDGDEQVYIGEMLVTEVETINSFTQRESSHEVQFVLGYGLVMGQNEAKAIAMAILERSLAMGGNAPAQDEEFVLLHIDNVEANGFVSHLKLPHYITFQSALDRIRQARETAAVKTASRTEAAATMDGITLEEENRHES